ncbi:MAG: hypothetical protein DME24_01370 [Verrucomicrobia bacterium]|nr:MAG: hypothetical protein DME24_01370 [Verrucomicrobiota bacterium]
MRKTKGGFPWTGRFVAQIGNLLCRGLPTRWSLRSIPTLADYQSAKQPTTSRRYSTATVRGAGSRPNFGGSFWPLLRQRVQ